ncbi:AMP-binding protein [Sphaerisporangium sp. B11E5]|uniref:AMP-binding protein n=1 Tax=Sphaerisporangium sp. B11E5 TaxID=3153563 RepID=UPI00325DAA44
MGIGVRCPGSTDGLLRWWADRHPDRVAHVSARGRVLTYRQWWDMSQAVAEGLRRRGVGRGFPVGLSFPREAMSDFAVCLTAAHRLGATTVLLPADETADGLSELTAACPPGLVVTAEAESPVEPAVTVEAGGRLPWPIVPVDRLAEPGDAVPSPSVAVPGDVASVVFTSGTTGTPKAVAITHEDLAGVAAARWAELTADTSAEACETVLHAYQLSTAAGQWAALAPLLCGMRVVTAPRLDPRLTADLIEDHQVTELALVPAMAGLLLTLPHETAAGSVRRVTMGTARCPAPVLERVRKLFPGAEIWIEYSSTESGAAGTAIEYVPGMPPDVVGRAGDGEQVRVVDEQGMPLAPNGIGVVELRVPPGAAVRSYVGDPSATMSTFRGRWVRMPDVGYVDEEGFLHLVGRTRDFVNLSGRKVACSEVERIFEDYPGVVEAAAFPVDDAVLGEELALVVQAGQQVRADDLRAYAAERLPSFKVPGKIAVVDELPRTRNGKVRKSDVAALLAGSLAATGEQHDDVVTVVRRAVERVLGHARIPADACLFDLGMSSLQLIRLHHELSDALGTRLDIGALSMSWPLAELSADIERRTRG